jgi:hypothetical protein
MPLEKSPSNHALKNMFRQWRCTIRDLIDVPGFQEPPCSREMVPQVWLKILKPS